MNNRHLPTVMVFVLLAFCTRAESLDITESIKEIVTCSMKAYTPAQGEFDAGEFNSAWELCEPARERLIQSLPVENRAEWIDRLEKIRTSMIARFEPQPMQDGYGLNPEEPVTVGGIQQGPQRSYAYFARLRDSQGESVTVRRIGSCCRFQTPNALIGEHASLDQYEVTTSTGDSTVAYVNIYDDGNVRAVEGFSLAPSPAE